MAIHERKRISIRLEQDLWDKVVDRASNQGLTATKYIRGILAETNTVRPDSLGLNSTATSKHCNFYLPIDEYRHIFNISQKLSLTMTEVIRHALAKSVDGACSLFVSRQIHTVGNLNIHFQQANFEYFLVYDTDNLSSLSLEDIVAWIRVHIILGNFLQVRKGMEIVKGLSTKGDLIQRDKTLAWYNYLDGVVLFTQNKTRRAEKAITSSLVFANLINDRYLIGLCYCQSGYLYRSIEKYELSKLSLARAIDYFDPNIYPGDTAQAYAMLAHMWDSDWSVDKSVEFFQEAEKLLAGLGNLHLQTLLNNLLSSHYYFVRKDPSSALAASVEACDFAEKSKSMQFSVDSHMTNSEISLFESSEDAIELLEHAYSLHKSYTGGAEHGMVGSVFLAAKGRYKFHDSLAQLNLTINDYEHKFKPHSKGYLLAAMKYAYGDESYRSVGKRELKQIVATSKSRTLVHAAQATLESKQIKAN